MNFTENNALFDDLSAHWWDEQGPFKPLHAVNPLRVSFLCDNLHEAHVKNSCLQKMTQPLKGLRILDVGCGGGLLCEPLHRLGATVKGIDTSPRAIEVANAHSQAQGFDITYACQTLQDETDMYDVVIASEVIEHVPHPQVFVQHLSRTLKPGGGLMITTLNRTIKSYIFGIIAAEYVLKWAPKGTHDHKHFVTPGELDAWCASENLTLQCLKGLSFSPFSWTWHLSADTSINYFAHFSKAAV